MDKTNRVCFVSGLCLATVALCVCHRVSNGQTLTPSKTEEQIKLEEMEAATAPRPASVRAARRDPASLIALLPEDGTPRFAVGEIRITGNSLLSSETLLRNIPAVFDASGPKEPSGMFVYDFRPLKRVIEQSEPAGDISARSIQGFTQYLLSLYQQRGYAGIYIYVPSESFEPGRELSQGILPIRVLEAPISSVGSSYYDVENRPSDKPYLRPELLKEWSPIKPGHVANRRAMDEYLNLLNRNPDRYVSAVVSQGAEPNSLAVEYRVYEANPWHFFAQLDNAGTRDVRWSPRFGLINTNLLGYDDRLTVIWQTTPDSTWLDQYAVYGSYDFPLFTPRLRLNIFAGHSEFDIAGSGAVSFLGRGSFVGGTLRYNLFQYDKWFFDVTGTLSHHISKVSPRLAGFPGFLESALGTDTHLTLWGWGMELSRTDDMTDTLLSLNRTATLNGSDQSEFGLTRTAANRDAAVYSITARHSRYLDTDKVQRLSASFQWIIPNKRLAPVRMTSFGGMYTVRGYDEYEIVADGGILASMQYEYDIIRKARIAEYAAGNVHEELRKPFVRKVAPLVFTDYGQARIESPVGNEHRDREMFSVGGGAIVELGDHFTGTVYYGHPLIATDRTRSGKGRLNVGFLYRW